MIAESIVDSSAPVVTFCGGEPLVVGEDIWSFASRFRAAGKRTILNTNGELLVGALKRNPSVRLGDYFDVVGISMDAGSQDVHRDMRGKRANLDRALEAVDLVQSTGLTLKIATVVSKVNIGHLASMASTVNETIRPSVWRLYQYSGRGEYNRGALRHELGRDEFETAIGIVRRNAPDINIEASISDTANCFIISPEAKVLLPSGDNYDVLGDLRDESIDSMWERDPLADQVISYKSWIERV